jgi:DNA polymerase-1
MNESKKALLFVVDYTDRGGDRLFMWSAEGLSEVTAEQVVAETGEIVCHDYWLIAPSIFKRTLSLPPKIVDVEELRISTSGRREDRESRDHVDISMSLGLYLDVEILGRYKNIFNRKSALDLDVLTEVGSALVRFSEKIEEEAKAADEWARYTDIERPVAEYLIKSAAAGIAIDETALRAHKKKIEFDYYMALKNFSALYSMPLELPSDDEVMDYLTPKGFDFSGVNVDYVLKFVPMKDKFAEDLLELRKLSTSRKVLAAIPFTQRRIFPIVDAFGSITSRIYFKDPSLQNLAKRHRDILVSDAGMALSYVDFEQYEAGIMAILAKDEKLLAFYASGDLYVLAAEQIFKCSAKRKEAKRLFLSYAYGMKRKNLVDAACGYGAERLAAKEFFGQFETFESWKAEIWGDFKENGRIGTSLGNYRRREQEGDLTDAEKRSAVSQVVQGTASLIFKKALLRLSSVEHIALKVPMHDAVLFQHPLGFDISIVEEMFSQVMSEHFGDLIKGKASRAQFVQA